MRSCAESALRITSELSPSALLTLRLIDLVAEDNALSDTIYHLTRALDAERIDLDRYLKAVRQLAREQYMKRALIEKILNGMGQTW